MPETKKLESIKVELNLLQKNMEYADGEITVNSTLVHDSDLRHPVVEFSVKLPSYIHELVKDQCVQFTNERRPGHGHMVESLSKRKRSDVVDPILRNETMSRLLDDFDRMQQEAFLINRFLTLKSGECIEDKLLFVDFSSSTQEMFSNRYRASLGGRTLLSFQYCVVYRAKLSVPKDFFSPESLVTRYRFHSGEVGESGSTIWHNDITEPNPDTPEFLNGKGVLIPWTQEREDFLSRMAASFARLDTSLNDFVTAVKDPETLDQAIAELGSLKLLEH